MENIDKLKRQLEYLKSGEYLKQVIWERDFNEKVVKDLQDRIDKAIEYIEKSKLNQLDTYCKYLHIDFDTGKIENLDELLDILKGTDKE